MIYLQIGGDATYHSRIQQTADSRLCSIAPNGALKETISGEADFSALGRALMLSMSSPFGKREQTLTSGLFAAHRAVWLSMRQYAIGADW